MDKKFKLAARIVDLHNAYLPFRNKTVPFPPESVAFWCYLLALQDKMELVGDFLELGVEHGGTAFLSILALKDNADMQILADIKRSPLYDDMFDKLPETVQCRVDFRVCNSTSPQLEDIRSRRFRFIHIDAGHEYENVISDIRLFSDCLTEKGILCMDDVFEIRWPGVTEAVLDEFPRHDLAPVALVNRKFYFSRQHAAEMWRSQIHDNLDALGVMGSIRSWEVVMRDFKCISVKMAMNAAVARYEL